MANEPDQVPTRREQILEAFRIMLRTDDFFPEPELDAPEPVNWRTDIPGAQVAMGDHCSVQDGDVRVTRDGGAENDWELELDAVIAYAVYASDQRIRRRRRDAAQGHIAALIRADRTLGLGDPQIFAEIGESVRDDHIPVQAAQPVALLIVTVTVQFVTSSAAG
jgi:hypothetical protein